MLEALLLIAVIVLLVCVGVWGARAGETKPKAGDSMNVTRVGPPPPGV
jgi:hypothetical protein